MFQLHITEPRLSPKPDLFIFPLTCGEWPNCGICRRSVLPWVLGKTPLIWSPTRLDFCQERTESCIWSMVGKASLGMWLWGDRVGPARGSSFSQQKGFSSWGCGKVRGQTYPVPTLTPAHKTHSWLSKSLRAAVEKSGYTTNHTDPVYIQWVLHIHLDWKYDTSQQQVSNVLLVMGN